MRGRDINVEEVWATTMGADINIAVVDDGLHYAHEDLAPNVITARNHDYFGSDVFDPLETHGTRVAGIIAARDNDLGGARRGAPGQHLQLQRDRRRASLKT